MSEWHIGMASAESEDCSMNSILSELNEDTQHTGALCRLRGPITANLFEQVCRWHSFAKLVALVASMARWVRAIHSDALSCVVWPGCVPLVEANNHWFNCVSFRFAC